MLISTTGLLLRASWLKSSRVGRIEKPGISPRFWLFPQPLDDGFAQFEGLQEVKQFGLKLRTGVL